MVVLLIHGGAGTIPEMERKLKAKEGVLEAMEASWDILYNGGSSLDAVEKAVEIMENNPVFNAGYGSVITDDEKVEMDALLMNGKDLNIGGVIAVSRIKHPIKLCRLIMEKSNHVLFAGEGAEKFASLNGMELINPETLITDRVRERLAKFKEKQKLDKSDPEGREKYGTVGAIAIDKDGNLAAATSTGGTLGKKFGRVGDTPIVGAGTYADDVLAISATGVGEYIIKGMLGLRVKSNLEKGKDVKKATIDSLNYVKDKVGPAGIIVLDKNGNWAAEKTTIDLVYVVRTEEFTKTFLDENLEKKVEAKSNNK